MTNLQSLVRTLMDECALDWSDNCTCKRCVTIRAIHAELEKPEAEPTARQAVVCECGNPDCASPRPVDLL
jgi:hypothetical protein